MSQRNGDKARHNKEHQKKLLRRKRNLALRQSLDASGTSDVPAQDSAPKAVVTPEPNLPTSS